MNRLFPLLLLVVLTSIRSPAMAEEPFLPEKPIAGLKYIDRKDYDQKELGYSFRYQSEDLLKADVYVYDLGIASMRDGIESPEVKAEMENAKRILLKLEEMGRYQNVKELESGERKFENLKTRFLWTRYSYRQTESEETVSMVARISDTFLLVHRGKFLKVRITTTQAELKKHGPQIDEFIIELARRVEKDKQA